MFSSANAFSGFAVKDTAAAKAFYGETLGIAVEERNDLLWLRFPGGREILAYPKADHTPATYTMLNFRVDDIDDAVDDLAARGVHFERYEGIETDEKGVNRAGDLKIAWFTDPSGNILSVFQEI